MESSAPISVRPRRWADFEHFSPACPAPSARRSARTPPRRPRSGSAWLDGWAKRRTRDWAFFAHCYANTYAQHLLHALSRSGFFCAARAQHARGRPSAGGSPATPSRSPPPSSCAIARRCTGVTGAASRFSFLHFELCYYQAIEYCIEHGLTRFGAAHRGAQARPRSAPGAYLLRALARRIRAFAARSMIGWQRGGRAWGTYLSANWRSTAHSSTKDPAASRPAQQEPRSPSGVQRRSDERSATRRRSALASPQTRLDMRQRKVISGDGLRVGDASAPDGLLHLVRTQAQHFETRRHRAPPPARARGRKKTSDALFVRKPIHGCITPAIPRTCSGEAVFRSSRCAQVGCPRRRRFSRQATRKAVAADSGTAARTPAPLPPARPTTTTAPGWRMYSRTLRLPSAIRRGLAKP